MSNAPGAPVFPSGRVVSFSGPKHGLPGRPSIGWVFLTVIGAAYVACAIPSDWAAAEAPTWTESTPRTLAKKPGEGRETWTEILSFGTILLEIETSFVARSGAFDV